MNFKKTNILLVIMSLVLLVSIGSVCAEDATADADVQTATDGPDVVLSNEEGSGSDPTPEETTQISTTINTTEDSYTFKEDVNATISVEVKDNESNSISINKTDLSVREGNTDINFNYTNGNIILLDKLAVGSHTLIISYLGNETYSNSSKTITLSIYHDTTLTMPSIVVSEDGTSVTIPITISNGIENFTVDETNLKVNISYINETGDLDFKIVSYTVNNNNITFNLDISKFIEANVTVIYNDSETAKNKAIIKFATSVNLNEEYEFINTDDVNITVIIKDAKGNEINIVKNDLRLFENGNPIDFDYNETTKVITIKNLNITYHNITVIYNGNNSYENSSKITNVSVYHAKTIEAPSLVVIEKDGKVEIKIIVTDGLKNYTVAKDDLKINLSYIDETGNIKTEEKDFTIDDNVINFDLDLSKFIEANATINYTETASIAKSSLKIGTAINSKDNDKLKDSETKNITLTIKDVDDNVISIKKEDLEILENGKKLDFTYNDTTKIITITSKLDVKVHNLTINYKGNNTYNATSKNFILSVYSNLTFDPSKTVNVDENNKATITLNLNDHIDLVDIDGDKLTLVLYYKLNNENKTKTLTIDNIDGQNVTVTIDEKFDSAYIAIKYVAETNLTANTTVKVNTKISTDVDTIQKGNDEVINFTVEITADDGTVLNITTDNLKLLNGNKELNIDYNNSIITIKDKLALGVYNLTIKYIGNDTFSEVSKNIILKVYGINVNSTSITVNSTKKGEININNITNGKETFNYTASDLSITVTYKDGNETKTIEVKEWKLINNTLFFELENGNFTTATLTLKYNNTSVVNITLNRKYNVRVDVINNEAEYQAGNFSFKIVDIDAPSEILSNRTIVLHFSIKTSIMQFEGSSVNVQSETSATTDENGIVIFNNSKITATIIQGESLSLPVGNNTVTLSGNNLVITNSSQTLIVSKANINIVIEEYKEYYGSDKKVKITVTNAKTGEPVKSTTLHLYMPDTTSKDYYFLTNVNGTSEINVAGLISGNYKLTVSNNDTANINNKSVDGTIVILKIPITISTKDVTVLYNTGTTTTIKIIDKRTNKPIADAYVALKIDSTQMGGFTDKNGLISVAASLKVGKHKITVTDVYNVYTSDGKTYLRNIYDYSQVTKTITVKKASAKITAKKVTDYYKGVKSFTVKLTNTKNGKAIYDAKINIKIFISSNRYYNYNGNTGSNGQLKLLLNTLKPGTYKVVVSGADSKDFSAKQVTTKIVIKKAPTKLTPKKLTAKKGAKKYFKVTVTNKKTKKVIAGVKIKIKVYTGKKAKTYTVKTNSKGIAQISTKSLKVGKHKVVVTSANKYCVAKTAKSTIKIKK